MEDVAQEPLYFLHIPRTAGTALTAELDNRFRASEVFPGSILSELVDVEPERLGQYRLFRGHFGIVLPRLLDWRVRAVTVVREPVAMVASLLSYIRSHPWHPLHARVTTPGYGPAEFVRDPEARVFTANWQARWLAVEPAPGDIAWTRAPPGDLAGWRPEGHQRPVSLPPDELLARARMTFDRMEIVGTTERLNDTMRLLADSMGWVDAPAPGRRNVSASPPGETAFTVGDLELLAELNQVDAELHRVARQRLDGDTANPLEAPVHPTPPPLRSPYDYDCSMPLVGTGWHPRAFDARVGWHRWTGPGTESVLVLPVAARGVALVEVWVVAAATPDLLPSLAVAVEGADAALAPPVPEGLGVVYRGTVEVDAEGPVRVMLRLPRTGSLGGEQGFGVAVTKLRLSPL